MLAQEVTIPLVVRWERVKLPIRPLKRLTDQLQRAYETSTWSLVGGAVWGGLGVEPWWRKYTTGRLYHHTTSFYALCFMLPAEAVVSQLPVPAAMPVA